ncbi:MAG: hypothetical protein ACYS47_08625 [Planctomycetota bacterium]|jgi:predicted esterase
MRLQILAAAAVLAALMSISSRARGEEGTFPKRVELQKYGSHYYLNVPRGYFDKKNEEKKWPMIVGLHGAGDTAQNFCGSFYRFAEEGYVICAVKSPGHAWAGNEDRLVFAAIDHVKKGYRINDKRISLGGFSSGSFFGMPFVFRHPKIFDALLAMGGGTPVPVSRDAKHLHVYLIAGEQDPAKGGLEAAAKQLKKKKVDVTLRIVPDLGHEYPPVVEMETILKWFLDFAPEAVAAKTFDKKLQTAKKGLKKPLLGPTIKLLKEIAESGLEHKAVDKAKDLLLDLREDARNEIEDAFRLAESGKVSQALSLLVKTARKYEGLPEGENAKVIANELR